MKGPMLPLDLSEAVTEASKALDTMCRTPEGQGVMFDGLGRSRIANDVMFLDLMGTLLVAKYPEVPVCESEFQAGNSVIYLTPDSPVVHPADTRLLPAIESIEVGDFRQALLDYIKCLMWMSASGSSELQTRVKDLRNSTLDLYDRLYPESSSPFRGLLVPSFDDEGRVLDPYYVDREKFKSDLRAVAQVLADHNL